MRKSGIVLLAILMAGCGQREQKKLPEKDSDKPGIFPVTSFIQGQIYVVDSFQSITLRYITRDNKTDTSLISIPEFKKMAGQFFHPDFNDPSIAGFYKENSFADQSSKTVVFNYTTGNKDLEIQRVDVVVDANVALSDKVRSIYMEKQHRVLDTFFTEKLYWRTDRNFQIIRSRHVKDLPETMEITKVEWDI